ncbi:MAG: NADP-dependent phosphogluconate dehydrogenase [Desulforhopalus sp.]
MADLESTGAYDMGLVGLGVMGSNFALNMADHGFSVAGYNRKEDEIKCLSEIQGKRDKIVTTGDFQALCRMVRKPRAILLLVPAGDPVDAVVDKLAPHLDEGDLLIDSGNSHFSDTERRSKQLERKGLLYMGMGMSGGERGARHGPSLMPGGPEKGYERVKRILEAVAARVGETPCVAYMGPGAAGHYVKMVHNGIEYALMELIAESYDLMKRGLGLQPEELHEVYHRWNQGVLSSYLLEITADIFQQKDEHTGRPLIDMIADQAKQKGTGKWTVTDALNIQVPMFTIDAAVMMRHLSAYKAEREEASASLHGPDRSLNCEKQPFIDQLENGLLCAVIAAYAQGMALLKKASLAYEYNLQLEKVVRVWTGGCIIRADLLKDFQSAYRKDPDLTNLLLAPAMRSLVETRQKDWRRVVQTCIEKGIPAPGLSSALTYWDAYRSGWLPANLIMAQRDYFGAHTYLRVDAEGTFHTRWDTD